MYRVEVFHGFTLDENGDTRYHYEKKCFLFKICIIRTKVIDYRGFNGDTKEEEEEKRPIGFQSLPMNILRTKE